LSFTNSFTEDELREMHLLSWHEGTDTNRDHVGYRILFFPAIGRGDVYDVYGYWEDLAEAVASAKENNYEDDTRTSVVYYGPENLGKDWK